MSPEALSELIFNIANNLVNEGKAGTLTTDLIPPQAKFAVMRPKDRAHGDWASNAAMQLAKKAGMKPHDFAELFASPWKWPAPASLTLCLIPRPPQPWLTLCLTRVRTTARTTIFPAKP